MSALNLDLFIDGAWTPGSSGDRIKVTNPARPAEVVGSIPAGTSADVGRAVDAASRAQRAWASRSLEERCALVKAAGEALAAAAPTAGTTLTREMGKVLAESMMDFGASAFGWSALVDDVEGVTAALSHVIDDDFGSIEVRRRPVGVVGAIVPWNWPIALLGVKVGPALVAGNTIVAAPSPFASLAVLQAAEALSSVLPPGVVNVVTGQGDQVGAALVAHPTVAMIAFTGGVEVGREVASSAGRGLKRTVLELGGNDAAVLLDDVAITDELIASLAAGFSMTSGQVCFAIKRLYVHQSKYAEVVGKLKDALAMTVVGDGLDPEVTMGPLANAPQHARFDDLMKLTERQGANVQELGRLKSDGVLGSDGFFQLPKLITDVSPEAPIVVKEQFGPALPILPFIDDAEAVDLVDSTAFGLTASIWSSDSSRARAVAAKVSTGVAFINQHGMLAFDPRAPFGGTKESGYGREMGIEGMLEFTWTQVLNDRHVSM